MYQQIQKIVVKMNFRLELQKFQIHHKIPNIPPIVKNSVIALMFKLFSDY